MRDYPDTKILMKNQNFGSKKKLNYLENIQVMIVLLALAEDWILATALKIKKMGLKPLANMLTMVGTQNFQYIT